jgi:hypothetical protein
MNDQDALCSDVTMTADPNSWETSWLTLVLLHAVAPLLVSTSLLAMVANVTGSGPWSVQQLLNRNHLVPILFVMVTWNGLSLLARFGRSVAHRRD